jgi:uncharacterized protein
MFISREANFELSELCKSFPVVTITGPRQSGKTTLLQHVFPDKKYFSLEDPDIRQIAISDPRSFLESSGNGMIIDEIQRVPELVSYIQGIADQLKIPGYFLLSGSQQFELSHTISQSLAGRTGLLKLLPFSTSEIKESAPDLSLNQLLFQGLYPRLYNFPAMNPTRYYNSYLQTYIERDLRQMANIKDLRQFELFVRLCAGRTGQVFVASNLANEVGVSVPTIQSWLSLLEASYIVYLLPPYHANLNKRLVKSPKIFFYDTGLAAFLTGMNDVQQMAVHPLRGALFENLSIMEVLKLKYNFFRNFQLYFYRESNLNEVDLLLDYGIYIDAIEIKSSETFDKSFLKGLNHIRKILPGKIRNTTICYAGQNESTINEHKLACFRNLSKYISS